MTTTQQLGVSILSAPLAAIDRRALSQAWYSALRIASDGRTPPGPAARGTALKSAAASRSTAAAQATGRTRPVPASRPANSRGIASRAGVAVERRSPRSPLARRIERALFEPRTRAARTAFAIGTGGERVVVVLHGAGDRVRLVALCSPASRRAVARALEEARFALAARGIALETGIAGEGACS